MAASLRSFLWKQVTSNTLQHFNRTYKKPAAPQLTWCRNLTLTKRLLQEDAVAVEIEADSVDNESLSTKTKRLVVDVETSIRYVDSKAFQQGYGDKPVWFHYRRNFKGQIAPKTRKSCVRKGELATSSPCPICRDEYLVLDAKNTKLLEQFISPFSGEILETDLTGLCQMQQKNLVLAVLRAQNEGRIEKPLPFRTYNYDDYKS